MLIYVVEIVEKYLIHELKKEVSRHPVRFLHRELGEAKGGQASLYKRSILLIRMLSMASRLRNINIADH